MPNNIENNKRIAKNTIALYIRTFVSLIVGLYTARVMLHALGVEDYGVNSVVGGIIAFSSLITGAMSQSISRYLTYSLGQGNTEKLKTVFSTAINAQIIMSVITVVFLEVIGIWFLKTQANIPDGRMVAAHWVFHCSIITLVIGLISSPFNAVIVAHEKMGVYAYTSIGEALAKLAICFIIQAYGGDRLILLSVLYIFLALVLRVFYGWYCGKHFEEAHYNPKVFDKSLLKEITIYSSWNLLNNSSYVFSTQGVNMLINVFFGVVFNASRQIANTVNGAVQGFVHNFATAFSPQITKSYAAGDKDYAISLANRGTRFQWLMMFLFIVPICMEAETLLQLWLGQVPEMAPLFLQLTMFESLAVCSGQNLLRLIQADGRVKNYTIHAAITAGLIFPLSWIAYKLGAPVWTSYIIFIVDFFALNLVRFYDIKKLMSFSIRKHIKECLLPCIKVSVTSFIVPILVSHFMEQGIVRFIVIVLISVLWTGLCCFALGLTKNERKFLLNKVSVIRNRIIHRGK